MTDEKDPWAEAMAEQAQADAKSTQGVSTADPWAAAMAEQMGDELMPTTGTGAALDTEVLMDIPVDLSIELGRTKISIRNLLQLNQGSVVELDRLAGEPLDVLINNTLVAHGEVVVVNDKFGVRLTDVISPEERVKKLK
jgi:flagellar motor switch protein FliN/FliY